MQWYHFFCYVTVFDVVSSKSSFSFWKISALASKFTVWANGSECVNCGCFKGPFCFFFFYSDHTRGRRDHDHFSIWLPCRIQSWIQLCRIYKLCNTALGWIWKEGFTVFLQVTMIIHVHILGLFVSGDGKDLSWDVFWHVAFWNFLLACNIHE